MTLVQCPQCASTRIRARNIAAKTGGALGTIAGAASGAAGAWRGARTGMVVGSVAPPAGPVIGTVAGAVLGGIFGGTLGLEIGATLGRAVDNNILDNFVCLACEHPFSINQPKSQEPPKSESRDLSTSIPNDGRPPSSRPEPHPDDEDLDLGYESGMPPGFPFDR